MGVQTLDIVRLVQYSPLPSPEGSPDFNHYVYHE